VFQIQTRADAITCHNTHKLQNTLLCQ